MLFFFAAEYNDAAPYIKRYGMKKLTDIKKRQVFRSENTILVICGTGAVNASVSVACAMQSFGTGEGDFAVGIGMCESGDYARGEIVICNKLRDATTGRDFYPDMLYSHPFNEGSLVSGDMLREDRNALHDSLGAFIYQAAVFFVPVCNIHIILHVSNEYITGRVECVARWLEDIASPCGESSFNGIFSHVYIEESVLGLPLTQSIAGRYPESRIILVNHYKDVFCKKGQDFTRQKKSPKLLLAANKDKKLHEGSAMCDNFGHENFYYCTHVMNCLYDCEYCYLQGMYASANVVIFVNYQEVFEEVEKKLRLHSLDNQGMYVCISYDGDLLLLEGLTGFVRRWLEFAKNHKGLEIELRTKSAAFDLIMDIPPVDNVMLSWTFTPQEFIDRFEHGAPSQKSREKSAARAIELGWRVRICVDPMLKAEGCEDIYRRFFADVKLFLERYPKTELSTGVFRAPVKYIRKLKKQRPESELICYKYINGTYSENDREELLKIAKDAVK